VILLGLAFGVVNEGMAAHSLFDPNWPALGALMGYGRAAGVNWIWAEWIVPFHAVWSISFPIFLAGEFWPDARNARLLTDRWTAVLAPVPVVAAIADGFVFGSYPLSALAWTGLFAATACFVAVALRWGPRLGRIRLRPGWTPRPWQGAVLVLAFFAIGQVGTWRMPSVTSSAVVAFVVLGAAYLALGLLATAFDATAAGERARFAGVLAGVGFYVALSPIAEFAGGRIGLVPIDVTLFVLLLAMYRRRTRPPPAAGPTPG